MILAHVVHRITTDRGFAAQVLQEPQTALAAANFVLDDESLAAILAVLRNGGQWTELCSPTMNPLEPYPWYSELAEPAAS